MPTAVRHTAALSLYAHIERLTLLAVVLVLLIAAADAPAAAKKGKPSAADAAVAAMRGAGKLNRSTAERLRTRLANQGHVRVMLRLRVSDPSARLGPRQARSRHARKLRKAAIARAQVALLGRGELTALARVKRLRHMPVIAAEIDASTLAALEHIAEIQSVHEDRLLWPTLNTSRSQLGADIAWADGFDGHDQTVAIIDTGVDALHPALSGRIVAEACFSTRSLADGTTSLCPNGVNPGGEDSQIGPGAATPCADTFGCDHGTHVAGIAAADDGLQGMAPAAGIIAIQVFSQLNNFLTCGFQPSCLSAYTSDVIRALEHVYDLRDSHPIAAVNMSLGSGGYTSIADCETDFPFLKAAIDNLHSAGIATVVASGNDGYVNALSSPACISSAFSVGAVDDFDEVGYFSNAASFLDTLAPGVDVVSTVPGGGFETKDGTSMAAPHVTGAVAAIRSSAPTATPDEIYAAITSTGVPINDLRSGITRPRIRIDAAIEHLIGQDLATLDLALKPIGSGLNGASSITYAGDGTARLFIALRNGQVMIHDGTSVLGAPFLDLSAEADCCAPATLVGLTFHPDYATNGLFYVTFTRQSGDLVLARYQVSSDADQADAGSRLQILSIPAIDGNPVHGSLAFGTDGYLYLATGDGAAPASAEQLDNLLGKILRLDIDSIFPNEPTPYAIPPDNPYINTPGARPEIWARGLHDPRGVTVDPVLGRLLISDGGETLYDEVNAQSVDSAGGEHYGWSQMEGFECAQGAGCNANGLTPPVGGFAHSSGCPIRGGAVNRNVLQEPLQGAFLFGDACSGAVFGLRLDADTWSQAQLLQTPLAIAAFGSGEDGSVYLVDDSAGTLYRVTQSDLQMDTLELPQAYLDTPYSASLAASGGTPPYQWRVDAGALPPGLSLDPVNGTLSGTPSATGSSIITIGVSDAGFASQTRRLGLSIITPPLVIDSASVPHAIIGELYEHQLLASGGLPPYSWQSLGALPAGLTLDADGRLHGVPDSQGVLSLAVQVSDAADETTSRTIGLRVYGPVLQLPVGFTDPGQYGYGFGSNEHTIGLLARFQGGTTDLKLFFKGWDIDYTDEVAVYLNDTLLAYVSTGPSDQLNNGDVLVIAAATQRPGSNELRFEQATSGFKWGVTGLLLTDLEITTSSLANALFGSTYGTVLQASGGRSPYTWQLLSGSLPSGLMLNTNGSFAGLAGAQGDFDFEVQVTDADGKQSSAALTLRVLSATGTVELVLQPGIMNSNRYGWNYGGSQHRLELIADFVATGEDMVLGVSGFDIDYADEVELLLNGQSLGYLSVGLDNGLNARDEFEIPAATQQAGANRLTFRQRTSGFKWGVTDLLLSNLRILTTALPDATHQTLYRQTLAHQGGQAPYSWQLVAGSLPPGMSLLGDGTITGTATAQGQFTFTVEVADANGQRITRALALTVIGSSGTFEVVLIPGIADTGKYGWQYGSSEHPIELYASFTGTGQDLTLSLNGYDMDYADEVEVLLNGASLGYLSVGPDRKLNAGDEFSIPAGIQQPQNNLILFRVRQSGFKWGVTNLLLSHLRVADTALSTATYQSPYTQNLTVLGGRAPYQWHISAGALPVGMSLLSDGTLTGVPEDQGSFQFTAEVVDADTNAASRAFVLDVVGTSGTYEVVLQPGSQDAGKYGWNYGSNQHRDELYAVFMGGTQHLALRVTGYDIDYDDEVQVLVNGQSLGFLSAGANNANNGGDSFHIPLQAQQSGPNLILFKQRTSGFTWGVSKLLVEFDEPPLAIDTESLASATVGIEYSQTLSASNGLPPYGWQLLQGTLPPGISLGTDGLVQGVATTQGSYPIVVEVSDAQSAIATRALTLDVVGANGALELTLTPGVIDPGEYGRGFGSDAHDAQLDAHFSAAAAGNDYLLSVIGFDIDTAQEVAVRINGTSLGYLSVGPDGALNAGDEFEIPSALIVDGENTISFEALPGGEIWGIKNLLIETVDLPIVELVIGLEDTAQYGHGYGSDVHTNALVSTFYYSGGDILLSVTGFDINSAAELQVILNGTSIGYLSSGPVAALNAGDTFVLPVSLLQIGRNQIRFQLTQPEQTWGIQNLLIAQVDPLAVVLEPGVVDTTSYGNKFGTNQHKTELVALFSGTNRDLVLELDGYDIDYVDELALYLNGDLLGYLRKGANNGYNGGDAFAIPREVQLAGVNELRFVVKTVGWKWGLRNLHLHDPGPAVALSLSVPDTGQYGYGYGSDEHPVEVVVQFDKADEDLVLSVVGYDIDYSDEVGVYVNDAFVGYLSKGLNNGNNAGNSIDVPLIDQLDGQNEVRFVQSTGGMIWGLHSLLLSPAP